MTDSLGQELHDGDVVAIKYPNMWYCYVVQYFHDIESWKTIKEGEVRIKVESGQSLGFVINTGKANI